MADKTLLLKNANLLCTMGPRDAASCQSAAHVGRPGDHCGAEIKNGGLFARNGVIEAVGDTGSLPADADTVIDMTGPCGDTRHGQHASSYVSKSHTRRSSGAKCPAIWLVANALPNLEQYWP